MLKVKVKYVTPAKLASAKPTVSKVGKKYATVTATTLVDVDSWLKEVGAVTMGYKAGGVRFLASTGFLTQAKLEAGVLVRFYSVDGKRVAKWVV